MHKRFTPRILAAALAALASGGAWASGFALQNQTGSGNGNAFAGAAAAAEDAGTIFFNPAGMMNLSPGHHLSVAGTILVRSIEFTNKGTTVPTFTGDNGGDAGGVALIPAGYFSYALSPNLRLGLGISPTFGNVTEYDQSFIGRFSGYYADLKQININPSVAWKVNETVSLGFGLNWAKNEVEFRLKTPIGVATQTTAILEGDDDAWGWNAGVMFNLSQNTRLGLAYRSKIKFDLEGNQIVVGVPTQSFAIRSRLETPDSFSIAVSHQLNERTQLLADYTWTGWSSVKSLPVYHASSGVQVNSLSYNFDDTYRVGFGVNYQWNDAWKLRFGIAYDKTPVQSDADRTMTLPDADRTWLSFGAKWKTSKQSSWDFGYTHIFFKDVSTTRQVTYTGAQAPFSHTVRGSFETTADLLSVQYNHGF
ncbi:OmpP1/FadL family transporter [Sulfuricystis multivorans]|uniref:OmpP1/FadL family transporter n=1 Tax=Sulfuricystis multivorans TaxID=2211108 RepID=UPI000F8456E2|nr:OmpP1/FadL family transporter [Sulfuricystis multivorans]